MPKQNKKQNCQEVSSAAKNLNQNNSFINPYTFVPIEDKEPERMPFIYRSGLFGSDFQQQEEEERISGYIECRLSVKTPLFIPNTSKAFEILKKGKGCYFYEFFSYEDLSVMGDEDKMKEEHDKIDDYPRRAPMYPRIPGSEIRGAVRNIYEQLTNSCLCVIDEKNLPYWRTSAAKKPGILNVTTGELYEAERLMLNTGKTSFGKRVPSSFYDTGSKVFVVKGKKQYITSRDFKTGTYAVDNISTTPKPGFEEGYVLIGEGFVKKHHDSVLIFRYGSGKKISIAKLSGNDIQRFEAVMDSYIELAKCGIQHKKYKDVYERKKKGNVSDPHLPVFYSSVKDRKSGKTIYYLSPSMITKEIFQKTISKILEENQHKHHPCDGRDGWCPACRLFGKVGQSGRDSMAVASRIRFSDSTVIENAVFEQPSFLPILGTPKYSATEFYLQKPNGADMWNYDYYTSGRSRTVYEAKLKGRKVYWIGKAKSLDCEEGRGNNTDALINKYKLNMTSKVRRLKAGECRFKVYFDDISKEELSCLLFCLDLKTGAFQRLGRGKPYGMGAVNIEVDKLYRINYSLDEGGIKRIKEEVNKEDYALSGNYSDAVNQILKYSQKVSESDANLVDYPRVLNSKEIYKWFGKNRGRVNREKIEQTLPELMKSEQKLLKYSQS